MNKIKSPFQTGLQIRCSELEKENQRLRRALLKIKKILKKAEDLKYETH